jgi:hypothetical protein
MVKFRATLKDTGHPIKIDSDGQAEVILVVPRSDLPDLLPIVTMGKKVLMVGIAQTGENNEVKDRDFLEWLKS